MPVKVRLALLGVAILALGVMLYRQGVTIKVSVRTWPC